MSAICNLLTFWYTVHDWLTTGSWVWTVGHVYDEPVYEAVPNADELESAFGGVPPRIEWEWMTCSRCGHRDGVWRSLWTA